MKTEQELPEKFEAMVLIHTINSEIKTKDNVEKSQYVTAVVEVLPGCKYPLFVGNKYNATFTIKNKEGRIKDIPEIGSEIKGNFTPSFDKYGELMVYVELGGNTVNNGVSYDMFALDVNTSKQTAPKSNKAVLNGEF